MGRASSRDRVSGHAYDIPSGPDRTIVEVLNGSGRNGLARLGTRRLRRSGLDVVYFGTNPDTTLRDSTLILLRRGDRNRADEVRKALGGGTIGVQTDTLRRVDVTVILGRDFSVDDDNRP